MTKTTKNIQNTQNSQLTLFKGNEPLAYKIRPSLLVEVIGQSHLLGENGVLTNCFKNNIPYSLVLWGPPGCGKTSLAFLARSISNKEFIYLSGASTSVSELREVINNSKLHPQGTILFLDEIHRLAKNQQDVLLEPIEAGILTLIGTTTENPHLSLTRALHSRVKVFELKPLSEDEMKTLIQRALLHPSGYCEYKISDNAIKALIFTASGDARRLLYNLEESIRFAKDFNIDEFTVQKVLRDSQLQIGADSDNYYNCISALQKSIRGSDPDAALYWLSRLLVGGADPAMIARRIMVTASEDIGLADNHALTMAVNAYQCAQFLGMPEARIPLAQAVIYLSRAPKSNTTIISIDATMKDVSKSVLYSVPLHLRNIGGKGYKYPHAFKDAYVEQEYLPQELKGKKYFSPNERDRI